jgi:hypothetical protein
MLDGPMTMVGGLIECAFDRQAAARAGILQARRASLHRRGRRPIEALGGDLTIDPEPGRGTSIMGSVRLP